MLWQGGRSADQNRTDTRPALREIILEKIEGGQIDPSFIITHRLPLEEAPSAYKTFRDKEDGCIKVVLKPSGQ